MLTLSHGCSLVCLQRNCTTLDLNTLCKILQESGFSKLLKTLKNKCELFFKAEKQAEVRDAKSGQHGQRACAIFSPAVLIFGWCRRKTC